MSESEDQQPVEPDPYEFTATAEFRYGIFLALLVVGLLAYGVTWVPRLFRSAAPASEASVAHEPPAAVVPAPAPGCRLGVGGCDWAGLRSHRTACHNGVGTCDWGGLRSKPPADKGALQSTPPGDNKVAASSPTPQPPTPQQPTLQSPSSQSAASPSPPPACHNGAGACGWGNLKSTPAAIQSPPPQQPPSQAAAAPCHNGTGNCDTAAVQSAQAGCHYGVGTCGWASRAMDQRASGIGNVAVMRSRMTRTTIPVMPDDCAWPPIRRHVRSFNPMRTPPPVCRECYFEG